MKTHYYCQNCNIYFYEEEKLPNINRVHYVCGLSAKLIRHFLKPDGGQEEQE